MAFRSVPRPSSPPGAKASTERPSLALSYAKSEALASDLPSCTGTIQPSRESKTYPHPGSHRTRSMGSLQCRLIPDDCENNHLTETDAPSSTSILFTPLNTSGCRDLVLTHLLRSDLQPARPDAPNPDSHVKRTKDQTFIQRPSPHPYDHRPATSQEAPLNAHTICFPTATASLLPEQSSLWRWTVSNRRPPACKAGALPLSYTPRRHKRNERKQLFLVRKSQRTFIA